MRKHERALAFGGRLLAGFLVLMSYGAAQDTSPTLTTLYAFTNRGGDSYQPKGLTLGQGGVLYGATYSTVFSLTPPVTPGGPWTETVLYTLCQIGCYVNDGLVLDPSGVLYGTTNYGGDQSLGSVFSLAPPTSPGGSWTGSQLYSFLGEEDGAYPLGGLARDPDGVLYGTTNQNGVGKAGTVFSLSPSATPGGTWTIRTLHSFSGGDGGAPRARVVIGTGGVLYGTTSDRGAAGKGTAFSLTPPASAGDSWTETVLYSFQGTPDGGAPYAELTIGSGGVLYGTTRYGGATGVGTVFSLTPPATPGGVWTETVLHSFDARRDGAEPWAGVAIAASGSLCGTTAGYIRSHVYYGTAFVLAPPATAGDPWQFDLLHTFTGGVDEGFPQGTPVIGARGAIYGTTGGANGVGYGTVFSITQ